METIPDHWLHYIDDDLIIVNKPSGLPSVPGRTPRYSQNLYHLLSRDFPPVYIVHRLDINTSGLIVFARTKSAQRHLNIAFQERRTHKKYRALLNGKLQASCGEIRLPIITDWHNRPLQKMCFEWGKDSITQFKRLAVNNASTLVEFTPITGRSHQLRIHAQLIGHPIVGCRLYGLTKHTKCRLMLHAYSLSLPHPANDQMITFTCPENFLE